MRKKVIIFISLALFIIVLAAFTLAGKFPLRSGPGNPTAHEILNNNPNADILKLDGVVYSNVSDRDWVERHDYNKNELIGEVKKQTNNTWWFRNYYASKLPKGTKIYSTNEGTYTKGDAPAFIIIEYDNALLIYQSLVEG
ncbi:hypothetical protein [Thalassobacillus sp. CUG 92003]|uniref:hypothetical protein n=1 Tax=Thalassobacillus sp. CUG 92003 TaxID=2736641 RepID=UPI0015E66897|nr:hypothetical protein [Thalassobacillus sp. CUG 92003]